MPDRRNEQLDWRDEASALANVRRRIWLTTLRQLLQTSQLRILVICGLTISFWFAMFVLFHEGFSLLTSAVSHPPTLARTIHAVYNVFFLSMLFMLAVSSAILYYATVFNSPETQLLLTLPIRPERIAMGKLTEATIMAGWGFLLMGSPLLVAYGVVCAAPLTYYVLLLPLLIAFAIIPTAGGAIACLLIVSIAPQYRRLALIVAVALLLVGAVYLVWAVLGQTEHTAMTPMWLQSRLARLRMAERRILPSWWLSTGLLESAHGGPKGTLQAFGFLCVLLSNALTAPIVLRVLARHTLRTSFGQISGAQRMGPRQRFQWFDRILSVVCRPLSPTMRTVLIKDLRLFRRDPLQWSQFLLFFGLLSFYFIYVRRFDYGAHLTGWMTVIGFMNLGVVGLILSTFTNRFLYPLVSMEGQRFWILGTAPVDRRDILWSKFIFAAVVTSVPCAILVLLSDIALKLVFHTPGMAVVHQFLCLMLSTGLSAIAVGLGAKMPNLRETSPAKIASGFGGTLTLILSALFVVGVVLPPSVPAYIYHAQIALAHPVGFSGVPTQLWLAAGLACSLVLTSLAIVIPLRMGFHAFRRMESL